MTLTEGAWSNHPCYILGGGPSLRSFNWDLLKGRKCIAINMAFLKAPWSEIFFTEDLRVLGDLIAKEETLKRAFQDFKGIKIWHCLESSLMSQGLALGFDLHIIERKYRDKRWTKTFSEGLSYSSNSAIGALNIADLLGANPIHLLGIDCSVKKGEENWHQIYPADWRMPGGQDEVYASDFTHWAALHLRHKQVINLVNPECPSKLKCWPTETLETHFK